MALSPGTRLGPYEILAAIGAGGMGEVYRARDPRLGREVAIKVLPSAAAPDADRLRRFEQEARAAAALDHPNILAVHDVGMSEGRPYVVSELLEGEDLRTRLRQGPLPVRKAVEYALQVGQGLAAAHERGIVHRDLKPENLFVTRDGRVKILDFGLAKLADPPAGGEAPLSSAATETRPGTVLGTVGYMSPEQVRGLSADHRSDLFAFGAILYEMLSGRRAFHRGSAVETLNAILNEDPADLSGSRHDLPLGLDRVARRCLEKDPRDRFQSARDLGFALEAAVAGEALPARSRDAARLRRSVAVLPFKDLSRNPENAHLGLGLADATITELALLKSLLVRPTSAILRYQDKAIEPEQAGRELSVDAVVDGNFQRAGSRLRVTVQLIGTAEGRPLWASKIDTSLDDIFQMQDEVSRKIAQALEVELTPAEETRLARTAAAPPAGAAYELYLQGRLHLFREQNLADVNAAIECFEKARDADPAFALAWAGLSAAYVRMAFTFDPEGDWHQRAEVMCQKALALDPALPEGRFLRGRLLWSPRGAFDHAAALREFAAAISARPSLNEAHNWMGTVLLHLGMFGESGTALEQALAVDPRDVAAHVMLGFCRYNEGRYGEALELTEQNLRRAPTPWGRYQHGLCQVQLGRLDEALRTADRAAREDPGNVLVYTVRALVAALKGDRGEAHREVELAERRKAFGHYHHAQYDVACVHALLGERDEALEWLTAAARNGYPCHPLFERDPLLRSVQDDERFGRLMGELRAECDSYRKIYAEMQSSSGRDSRT